MLELDHEGWVRSLLDWGESASIPGHGPISFCSFIYLLAHSHLGGSCPLFFSQPRAFLPQILILESAPL